MEIAQIDRYIEKSFEGVPDCRALRDFKEEIAGHLSEKVRDYMDKGLIEVDAHREAITSVGDIRQVYLDRSRPKKLNSWIKWGISLCVFILWLSVAYQSNPTVLPTLWVERNGRARFFNFHGENTYNQVILESEAALIEYSVKVRRGSLYFRLQDTFGAVLWEKEFFSDDTGQVVVVTTNTGRALVTIGGIRARGAYSFNVTDIKQ